MAQQERRRILFVGGVAPNINEQSLFQHFSHFCELTKVKIMREKKTRESKGYAYITVADPNSIAVILSNEHFVLGRKLDVQLATSKGEKRDWKVQQRCKRVYAVGLPSDATDEQVEATFRQFGTVRNAFIIRQHESRIRKEYAYVQFEDAESAELALGSVIRINGKVITCQPYWSRHEEKSLLPQGQALKDRRLSELSHQATQQPSLCINWDKSRDKPFTIKPEVYQFLESVQIQAKFSEVFVDHSRGANQSPSNYRFNITSASFKLRSSPQHL